MLEGTILQEWINQGGLWGSAVLVAWTITKIIVIILPVLGAVAYLTLAERKVIGYIQVQLGPNRVGPRGLGQPIADGIKLLFKEIIVPFGANKVLFLWPRSRSPQPSLHGRWCRSMRDWCWPTSTQVCFTCWP